MECLIKYKHFDDIRNTFGKVLKYNLLGLFFDKRLKSKKVESYTNYSIEFFIEKMIDLSISLDEIKFLINSFKEEVDSHKALNIFAKKNYLSMLIWLKDFTHIKFNIYPMNTDLTILILAKKSFI